MLALLLAVSLTGSPLTPGAPAEAESEAKAKAKAKDVFTEAKRLFAQRRYAEAILKFENAYAIWAHPVSLYNIGKCLERLGEPAMALRRFREYLRLEPQAAGDPSVKGDIANCERRLREKGVQQLVVFAEPATARIAVDGKPLSPAPAYVELKGGRHTLTVSADGYENEEQEFSMSTQHVRELTVNLRPAPKAAKADAPTAPPERAGSAVTPLAPSAEGLRPIKVAAPGLTCVGIEPRLGKVYLERFVNVLVRRGDIVVTTQEDVSHLLGLERQKQLLGCAEAGSSCMAELAGALGVDLILSGSLAKTGSSYTVNLRLLRAGDGHQVVTATDRLKSEDALQDWLDAQATAIGRALRVHSGTSDSPPILAVEHGRQRLVPWVPAIVGGALASGGAALFAWSKADAQMLRAGGLTGEDIDATFSAGQGKEAGGVVLLATGGVAIASSLVWALLTREDKPQLSVAAPPGGIVMGVSGAMP